MGQKESVHCSSVAACQSCRSRWAVIRKERDARALNQSRVSSGLETLPNWQKRRCSIATNTCEVCAIDLKQELKNKSATLFSTAIAPNACRTSRIFRFASLKVKGC